MVLAMFLIEDERHAEQCGQFATLEAAIGELKRRAALPWDQKPNVAPCANWRDCGRAYEIVEYNDSQRPWRELRRVPVLDISATGVDWAPDFAGHASG